MWQILDNKVFLAVAGTFCAALISALLYAINLRGQIADLREDNADLRENLTLAISQSEISKANLDACVAKIELVNEKTQSLRVKSEEAEQKAKRAGERLARVQTPQKDAGCERELKFYKELMNASY
ncbi:hypothetical protein [uncultured Campylobacter sp.]|uniref:hypothetical protein n=1 Tax=uncultured Campylobacter sp. TaxID=218934 RepID=UPI0025EDC3C5|nr:hypothetical protein [uncultured Campylobacter sp.]